MDIVKMRTITLSVNLIVVTAVVKILTFISAQNVNVWIRITYFSDGTKEFVK